MIKLFVALSLVVTTTKINSQITARTIFESKKAKSAITDIDFSELKIMELPRPNSGTYSFKEAGKRKNEIYNLQPTPKYFNWKNPTSGGAVHINKKDEIEVYQFTFGIYQYRNDTAAFYGPAPKDTFVNIKESKDLLNYVGGMGWGNPASVLLTSEISIYKSKAIKRIMKELWTPGVQLYYFTIRK